eukprot:RCo045929
MTEPQPAPSSSSAEAEKVEEHSGAAAPGDGEDGPKIEGEAKFSAVETATGEENEDVLWKKRAKLYRFDKESNQWKERGTGEVKFLCNTASKKIRLLMRRDGTLKLCANHLVLPTLELKPNVGSDRSWVWHVAGDLSEETPVDEVFAIRFQSPELATEFKTQFQDSQTKMKALEAS